MRTRHRTVSEIQYKFVSSVQLNYLIIDKFTHISMLITYISIGVQKYSDYNYKYVGYIISSSGLKIVVDMAAD